MPEVTDYIMANYVWFVVGSVIIIMAIIGYFADKKGFGKPKSKEKDKEQVKVEEKKEPVLEDNKEIKDSDNKEKEESISNEASVLEPIAKEETAPVTPVVTEPITNEEPVVETSTVPETVIEEPIANEEPTVLDVSPVEPITESISNDLPIENSNDSVPVVEHFSEGSWEKPATEDVDFASEIGPVKEDLPVENTTTVDEEPNVFMPTDDLTSTNENLTDEEDIWKF